MYENLDYEGINKNKNIYKKSNIKNLYDFYKKYYTSNNMKVVIYSYYKMNKLIENCVHYFKNIKNSNFEFLYEINFMNNDNNPKFFSFEKKTRCNTIKIFFTIESNNTQNYADNYNNLNYFDYFIKKNSHNDNCTLLYKLLENGVFEIETEIYEEINDIIIYKIELSIEDNNKDEIDKKNITEILDKVFDFVDYYSKYFDLTLFEKLTEFYNNAFYYIDKQDQYDFLTNFAARELFFKKENFSNFLNYKYLTKYTNFEIIKNDLSNINILISKNYSYNDSTFNYAYTYKVNKLNFTYNKTNEKKDDNYCNFSINISENYIDNKNNNLKKSFIKDCHNSKDFSTPIMYYFSNNEIEIPKVSYVLYIFNYYSKICDDKSRLSYFLYYIQIKT
jgi:secreted Zn-dependent insulinase-like peptidase